MIAYDCESERIDRAIKKEKIWLLPVYTEKPADKRFSINKIMIEDNSGLQGDF